MYKMKLYELASPYTKLYHRMGDAQYHTLTSTGELTFKRGTLCVTPDKEANQTEDFGNILLELNVKKLLKRHAKIVKVEYNLDWLEKNSLLVHVTGMDKEDWLEFVKGVNEFTPEELHKLADQELEEGYGDEQEVVIYIDKLLLSETKKL